MEFTRELALRHFRVMISFVKHSEDHFKRNLAKLVWLFKEIFEVTFWWIFGGLIIFSWEVE